MQEEEDLGEMCLEVEGNMATLNQSSIDSWRADRKPQEHYVALRCCVWLKTHNYLLGVGVYSTVFTPGSTQATFFDHVGEEVSAFMLAWRFIPNSRLLPLEGAGGHVCRSQRLCSLLREHRYFYCFTLSVRSEVKMSYFLPCLRCLRFAVYRLLGAGKTYTMFGTRKRPGVVPRLMEALFASEEVVKVAVTYIQVSLTFLYRFLLSRTRDALQVYNGKVQDLQTPASKRVELQIRNQKVKGAVNTVVDSVEQAMTLIKK